ncbi:phage holin family protein [Lutimonas zeaxanthinifaciens]|uniref:phage holin family protein n=1 Tax=Lutimonas zeaxanthinifaciens TaxID=3060215 RepID=UPI00265D2EC1|nr:phage holin family protein [Lutimonas sp. YSD2104]WKK65460.1 phage holin family protein [Lutimonas sp. YSD2104]
MNYIFKVLLTAVAVLLIAYFLPGVEVDDYGTAIWVAFIVGLLFSILKPILVILTLPATILTLGLFLFVINAAMILLANSWIDGFSVSGFWTALLFSILLSFVESILHKLIETD